MAKKRFTQGDTDKHTGPVANFLAGMYYVGQMPSRAESYAIAKYLRSQGLVDGTVREIEIQVVEAMTVLHREKGETDE